MWYKTRPNASRSQDVFDIFQFAANSDTDIPGVKLFPEQIQLFYSSCYLQILT